MKLPGSAQRGTALVLALAATVIPLGVILGAMSQSLTGRMTRLEREILDERALLCAESGIDAAIYVASTSAGLVSGVPITRSLGNDLSYTVTPTFLMSDGIDNDHDGDVDEPDESLFQVLSVGTCGRTTRRLVAFLGPETITGMTPYGALTQLNRNADIHVLDAASAINGHDHNINGSAGPAANDLPGVVVEPPGTVANLLAHTPVSDRPRITGTGAAPSFGTSSEQTDMTAIKDQVQNAANLVLTANEYNNCSFGNGATNSFNVIYRSGAVTFKGNSRGAGVMFITGDLHVEGTFRFDGVIYVLGHVEIHGTSTINGAMITGPACQHLYLEGTSRIYYSHEAVTLATAVLPSKYVALNGWQEISRH